MLYWRYQTKSTHTTVQHSMLSYPNQIQTIKQYNNTQIYKALLNGLITYMFGGVLREKAIRGFNHCAFPSLRKISAWQLANIVPHCLVTHINRDTHLCKMPGMEPFRHFLLCWWFLWVSVYVYVCVSETRWGSDPSSQYHANTSSPCAPWELLCVEYRLLVWLFQQDPHSTMLTHDPVALSAQLDMCVLFLCGQQRPSVCFWQM